ncbi:flagellar hook-associated protein FlgK [Ideonella sp. BN130291]|uniref:flagellar hook-associated protein FlgK n=1 Tax=Ideonella sp. BN130291 TaxID=3112940 RepID=UPI002E26D4E6|nr:flagellar hook-associated protein FlgK [Ideonella sp. BN130291]
MGVSAVMSLGVRAMAANYAALQATGNNIANANVAGYSRQQVELETAKGQYTGAGFFGKGVNVSTVTRSYDEFLSREAAVSKSIASMDKARAEQLAQLERAFPMGEAGIGYSAGQFLNAMVDVASNPQDIGARQVVLSRASELAARFNASATQLDAIQRGVGEDLKNSVKTVNELARGIADVNQKIAAVRGSGHAPNDLLDERDRLVSRLSELVQVSTVGAEDGTLGVFIAGGQRLVLGNQAASLQVAPDPADPARSAIAINDNGLVRDLPFDLLGAGAISGLLRFQNSDLVDARNLLGQMAAAFSARLNEQQSLGLDLRTPPGSGAPVFAVGAPRSVPNANNAKDASGQFISSVSLTTVDGTQLQASDYELQADPANAGAYVLTRLSDGLTRTIASGDVVDGMRIDVNAPAPGPNERFLLQPVARAANGMARVLDDPRALAAASPVTATVPATNTGTASVASLTVVGSSVNPELTANLSFTSATGDYAWELRDRTSNALVSSGTGTWTAGQPIALNGFELQLNGVPANGDAISIGKTLYPATNNGNALALAALRDQSFVGQSLDGLGQLTGGNTMTEAYAAAMADVGVRVQSGNNAADISASVAATAEQARSGQAGVNLDEEAARLIQYQQSYQAAAKVLQVAQQIFDTLLQTAGG